MSAMSFGTQPFISLLTIVKSHDGDERSSRVEKDDACDGGEALDSGVNESDDVGVEEESANLGTDDEDGAGDCVDAVACLLLLF